MLHTSNLRLVCPLLVPLLLAGCKSEPEKPPPRESATLAFRGLPDVNPNDLGEPTPVDVRIYRLKDPVAFRQASFEELWTSDAEALGTSLVGSPKVVTILPNDPNAPPEYIPIELEGATYVGLMALFSAEETAGVEERKVLVHVDETDDRLFEFSGHRILIDGSRIVPDAAPEDGEGEGEGEGDEDEAGDEGDGDADADAGDDDGDGDGDGEAEPGS